MSRLNRLPAKRDGSAGHRLRADLPEIAVTEACLWVLLHTLFRSFGRGSDDNVRPRSKRRSTAAMISSKRSSSLPLTACFLFLGATAAAAQQPPAQYRPILPSQKASVMQTIGVTDV